MAKSNEKKLKFYPAKSFSNDSLVPPVVFHDSETAFSLDGSVHSQKSSVNALKVVQNFLVQ